MLKVDGLDVDACPLRTSEIRVGGQAAPAVLNARHEVLIRLPLFYDEVTKWAAPPSEPQDVEVFCNGDLWFLATEAITITDLPPAPGTTEALLADYQQIVFDYKALTELLAPSPGIQQQLFRSIFAALEQIVEGTDPNSLPVLLAGLKDSDPEALALMDAMYAIGDVDEATASFKDGIHELSAQAAASPPVAPGKSIASSPASNAQSAPLPPATALKSGVLVLNTPIVMTDENLASAMSLYEDIRAFSETFIGQTAEEFSTVEGFISIFVKSKFAAATSAVLFFLDYIMNKLVVSAFPATLDTIDLRLSRTMLDNSQVTVAEFKVHASNVPALLTISDITSVILNTLGVTGSDRIPGSDDALNWINSLEEALPQAVKYGLETLDKEFKQYAASIPEGYSYDLEAFAIVPQMRFEAVGLTRELYKLYPDHSDLIQPSNESLQWQASDTHWGSADVFITPAPGTFGSDNTNVPSNLVRVHVGELALLLDRYRVTVPENGLATFGVKLSHSPKDGISVRVSAERFTGDSDVSITSALPISFDSSNWDEYQELVLAAADDDDEEDGEATIRVWTEVDSYRVDPVTIEASITATEEDDDRPRFVISTHRVSVPEGGIATFDVKLNKPPSARVAAIVTHSSGDPDIIVESPSIMRFDENNWDSFQTVTLYARPDDDLTDGTAQLRISANPPATIDDTYITAKEDEPGDSLSFRWVLDGVSPYRSIYTADGTVPVTLDRNNLDTPLGSATVPASLTVHYGDPPIQATGTATLTVRNHWSDTICYCGSNDTPNCYTRDNPEDYILAVDVQFSLPSITSLVEQAQQKGEARRDIVVIVGEDSPYAVSYNCGGAITGTIQASLH